jgi:hypothetical protein
VAPEVSAGTDLMVLFRTGVFPIALDETDSVGSENSVGADGVARVTSVVFLAVEEVDLARAVVARPEREAAAGFFSGDDFFGFIRYDF